MYIRKIVILNFKISLTFGHSTRFVYIFIFHCVNKCESAPLRLYSYRVLSERGSCWGWWLPDRGLVSMLPSRLKYVCSVCLSILFMLSFCQCICLPYPFVCTTVHTKLLSEKAIFCFWLLVLAIYANFGHISRFEVLFWRNCKLSL